MRFRVVDEKTLRVDLNGNESFKAESNAVVALTSQSLSIGGRFEGGFLSALFRSTLTGESLFYQVIRAGPEGGGSAILAAPYPGAIATISVTPDHPFVLSRGSFLAAENDVKIDSMVQSSLVNSFFSGTGLFLLRAEGVGTIALSAFGSLQRFDLAPGETLTVDNGHLVAWSALMTYRTDFANRRSITASLTSGEGLMCFFTGPGTVFVQSHNPRSFQAWVAGPQGGRNVGGIAALPCIAFIFFAIAILFIFGIVATILLNSDSGETVVTRGRY